MESQVHACLAGSLLISLMEKKVLHTDILKVFLTSNQVHIDKVWFHMSCLLWLVPQALQEETETQSQGHLERTK